MALPSLQPRRLGRYRDLALILFKYGRSDLLSRAGLEEILAEDLPATDPGTAAPEVFESVQSAESVVWRPLSPPQFGRASACVP